MGGYSSTRHRKKQPDAGLPEGSGPRLLPVYDTALVERLFAASPLVNADIRRTLAETYATLLMQIGDLRHRIMTGVISVDEARTIPPLINHLRKTAADLKLLQSAEELGLSLNPLATGKASVDETDDDANA